MSDSANPNRNDNLIADLWVKLRPTRLSRPETEVKNANDIYDLKMSPLDRFAVKITDRVGSMGFFFLILGWTILWCGYNILAAEVPALHWKAFDPFPAFVAYLLISNVIQILLMPLIMVGQNLQGRHSEIRAELDYEINKKAEREVLEVLHNLDRNTKLLIQLMKHSNCRISDEELKSLTIEASNNG